MVQFNEKDFTITIPCGFDPIEDWLETHDQLLSLFQCQDEQMMYKHHKVLELLSQMMPDYDTAKKMTDVPETKKK